MPLYPHTTRVDPHSGCTVITNVAALAWMGEKKGKTGAEVLAEIQDAMEVANSESVDRMKKPEETLAILVRCSKVEWAEWLRIGLDSPLGPEATGEAPPPRPVRVLRVLQAEASSAFGGNGHWSFFAEVECFDGIVRWVAYEAEFEAPSMDGPGGGGEGLEWLDRPPSGAVEGA